MLLEEIESLKGFKGTAHTHTLAHRLTFFESVHVSLLKGQPMVRLKHRRYLNANTRLDDIMMISL